MGCGSVDCVHPLCKSSKRGPAVSDNTAAILCLQLASRRQSSFCPRLALKPDYSQMHFLPFTPDVRASTENTLIDPPSPIFGRKTSLVPDSSSSNTRPFLFSLLSSASFSSIFDHSNRQQTKSSGKPIFSPTRNAAEEGVISDSLRSSITRVLTSKRTSVIKSQNSSPNSVYAEQKENSLPSSLSYSRFSELAVRYRGCTENSIEAQSHLKAMQSLLLAAFSDAELLNSSFLLPDATPTSLGLDIASIRSFYELIIYLVLPFFSFKIKADL